jgi:hypothetical protein
LGLGVGIRIAKSRVCAVILTFYFAISKILQICNGNLKSFSAFIAFLYIVILIYGTIATFSYQKLWKSYLAGKYVSECRADINMYNNGTYTEINSQSLIINRDGEYSQNQYQNADNKQ